MTFRAGSNASQKEHAPDFVERARKLWGVGWSAAEIGRELAVSKNSIIGIAHRNGFPARPSPIKRAIA